MSNVVEKNGVKFTFYKWDSDGDGGSLFGRIYFEIPEKTYEHSREDDNKIRIGPTSRHTDIASVSCDAIPGVQTVHLFDMKLYDILLRAATAIDAKATRAVPDGMVFIPYNRNVPIEDCGIKTIAELGKLIDKYISKQYILKELAAIMQNAIKK